MDGTYHVTRAAWPASRDKGYGRTLVTSSTSWLFGSLGQANHATAKLGVGGLVNRLAQESARCETNELNEPTHARPAEHPLG